jgi:hypothetical protein
VEQLVFVGVAVALQRAQLSVAGVLAGQSGAHDGNHLFYVPPARQKELREYAVKHSEVNARVLLKMRRTRALTPAG